MRERLQCLKKRDVAGGSTRRHQASPARIQFASILRAHKTKQARCGVSKMVQQVQALTQGTTLSKTGLQKTPNQTKTP